jgi:LmbE family N-acetylglucosaminyl deacetylase
MAAKTLGYASLKRIGLPDNRFDSVPLLELCKVVEQTVEELQPDLVMTHDPSDLNIDHQLAHRAVITVTRPNPSGVRRVMTFETLSSTEWQDQAVSAFHPNCYVALSESHLERKLKALEQYRSEIRTWPHPRSVKAVEHLARLRGSQIQHPLAEAFRIVRELHF